MDQKTFVQEVERQLKDTGTTLKWFLERAHISRTHWHFLRKGERPLSDAKKESIAEVLRSKIVSSD